MIQIYLRHDPIQMGHIFEQVVQSALLKLTRCLKLFPVKYNSIPSL
jgi:hypothetical protein